MHWSAWNVVRRYFHEWQDRFLQFNSIFAQLQCSSIYLRSLCIWVCFCLVHFFWVTSFFFPFISGKHKLTLPDWRGKETACVNWLSSAVCNYRFVCHFTAICLDREGGEDGGHLKARGVIIGTKRYQNSCFMGVVRIHFFPFEVSVLQLK